MTILPDVSGVITKGANYLNRAGQIRWLGVLAFGVTLAALFLIYDYDHILPKPPQTVHQWRQCDGNAIAMLYAHEQRGLFAPATYHQMSTDGRTAAEFPLLYYIDGQLIRVFGNRHLITRLTTLLLFYLGLFYLYRIGLLFTRNWIAALFPVILFHSLPVVAYYATTSLPNLPALSYLIIGIYYLLKHKGFPDRKTWALIVLLAGLAGMTKPTSLIVWFALMAALLITRGEDGRLPWRRLALMMLPVFMTAGWVIYINLYNAKYGSEVFLTGIMPYWYMPKADIADTWRRIREVWWEDYSYWPLMLWTILLSGLLFLYRSRTYRFFQWALGFGLLGCLAYSLLFFNQFHQHDYYVIEIYSVLVAFCCAAAFALTRFKSNIWLHLSLVLVTGLLLLKSIQYADLEMHERYTSSAAHNAFFLDYHELNPLLDNAGLTWEDKVIVPSDPSPNISLYLADQKGWTKFPDGIDSLKITQWIDQDAQYLIARKASFDSYPFLHHFKDSLLIEYKTLEVWSITTPQLPEKP